MAYDDAETLSMSKSFQEPVIDTDAPMDSQIAESCSQAYTATP